MRPLALGKLGKGYNLADDDLALLREFQTEPLIAVVKLNPYYFKAIIKSASELANATAAPGWT